MTDRSRFRWAWWLLAYISLGTGIVGIFVPGLPTTVFILIAAYAASRGSDRLHRYLLEHPRFGPMIRNWQTNGAVSRRAKWAATGRRAHRCHRTTPRAAAALSGGLGNPAMPQSPAGSATPNWSSTKA
jgi:uncharacterized membrane protein YbaN (DUF454 family)